MKGAIHVTFDRHVFFNLLGVIVLLLGVSAALSVHRRGENQQLDPAVFGAESGCQDSSLSLQDSKRLSADIERTWGKLGNLEETFSHLGGKLRHPQPLSISILVISLLGAFGCFFVADR